MPLGQGIPLEYRVGVTGAGPALGQIQGLTGAMRQSGAALGAPIPMGGFMRSIGGMRSALSGVGRMAAGILGGMGMAGGLMGFTKLVHESSDFHAALVSLQATLGESDARMALFKTRMEDLAKATGKSRTELMAAARAGTDYGLSLDEMSSSLGDLDALAKIMDVPLEMLMGGYGGLHKLAGDQVAPDKLQTMLFEGQKNSGMREQPFLDLLRRVAPQFAGDKRFEGQGGTALFLANVAALGENVGEDGKKLKKGLMGLLDGLKDTTPKTVAAFKKLGITTDDARKAEIQLLGAVLAGKDGIEDLPAPLRSFLDELLATEGATKRLTDTQDGLAGDLSEQGAELRKHLDAVKNEPTWDKLMERFKAPLISIADGIFTRIERHQGGITEALQKFGEAVKWAADNWKLLLAAWVTGKGIGALVGGLGGLGNLLGGAGVAGAGGAAGGAALGGALGTAGLMAYGGYRVGASLQDDERLQDALAAATSDAERKAIEEIAGSQFDAGQGIESADWLSQKAALLVAERNQQLEEGRATAINSLGLNAGQYGMPGFQGNSVVAAPSQFDIQLNVTSPNPVDVDAKGRQDGAAVSTTVTPGGAPAGAERFRIAFAQ